MHGKWDGESRVKAGTEKVGLVLLHARYASSATPLEKHELLKVCGE